MHLKIEIVAKYIFKVSHNIIRTIAFFRDRINSKYINIYQMFLLIKRTCFTTDIELAPLMRNFYQPIFKLVFNESYK